MFSNLSQNAEQDARLVCGFAYSIWGICECRLYLP